MGRGRRPLEEDRGGGLQPVLPPRVEQGNAESRITCCQRRCSSRSARGSGRVDEDSRLIAASPIATPSGSQTAQAVDNRARRRREPVAAVLGHVGRVHLAPVQPEPVLGSARPQRWRSRGLAQQREVDETGWPPRGGQTPEHRGADMAGHCSQERLAPRRAPVTRAAPTASALAAGATAYRPRCSRVTSPRRACQPGSRAASGRRPDLGAPERLGQWGQVHAASVVLSPGET